MSPPCGRSLILYLKSGALNLNVARKDLAFVVWTQVPNSVGASLASGTGVVSSFESF